jgi:histidinol dehydrogenase
VRRDGWGLVIIRSAMRVFEQGIDRDQDIREALVAGSPTDDLEVESAVRDIIAQVKDRGDKALLELGQKFDSPDLKEIAVSTEEIEDAASNTPRDVLNALSHAAENVRKFHQREKENSWFHSEGSTTLGQIVRPIDTVGIYVPGGKAAYPSTVLMTAIPASVAGVGDICIATPAGPGGKVPDSVLAACRLCGVTSVFKMGGAQAVAAFAYGTNSVPRVDKIVGPGNQYVNSAKRQVFGQVGIDSLAGPSEVLIIADENSEPAWVAADLISQAEHGGDSKSILVTWSRTLVDRVLYSISAQLENEPRAEYIRKSLSSRGVVLLVKGPEEALLWTNICAPEHLQIMVRQPQDWIGQISNAGAIFIGPYSPVPLGDYVAGPSHTLPTGASARFSSALGVAEFQKRTSLIWYGADEYFKDAPAAIKLADIEGLAAHKKSLELRLKEQA